MKSRLKSEWFLTSSAHLNRVVVLVLLFIPALPVNAEDICSSEAKSKMRIANVSEAQILRICPVAISQPITSVQLIDMDDLKTDIASLDGQKIRVRGIGQYMMDIFMIKKTVSDMSPMLVDISRLEREQRRKVIRQCADIMSGCNVLIHGTVRKLNFQNGIVAEKIEW